MCGTCIFRPGNLMHLERGRVAEMVAETRDTDAATIPCHSTIYDAAPQEAICRGWWDRYADRDMVLRLALALDVVSYV